MKEYLITLHEQFYIPSEEVLAQEKVARESEVRLSENLDKNRKLQLLRLMDAMNIYRLESQLCSFVAGYRLARGIIKELEEVTFPSKATGKEDL